MSLKTKEIYICQNCNFKSYKWIGQCTECGGWNTFVKERLLKKNKEGLLPFKNEEVISLIDIPFTKTERISTKIKELDRVLGGGLVKGSIVLIGGAPGIGKSTLLLQAVSNLSENNNVLYITGEESLHQIALRAERLKLKDKKNIKILSETNVNEIIPKLEKEKPEILVIDSIQTLYTEILESPSGSVAQVRESASILVRYAKQTNTPLFLVGHVTKDGTLAGPKVLEHMVDTVLYFEEKQDNRYRIVRAVKNRFGALNELGVFAMTSTGLKEIQNPSALFLTNRADKTSGNIITVIREGSRYLLIELQSLVTKSYLPSPKRITVGFEQNRLSMLLAALDRHGGMLTYSQDIFTNVVGGIKVTETALDLAVLFAIVSSLKDKPLPNDIVVFGEVGLSGEIRPVKNGLERLKEAKKHGFKMAIIPEANKPQYVDMEITTVKNIKQCVNYILKLRQ